jgi:succinate dehydrogenase/fumarate reductase flavoprotein subunit
MDDKQPLENDLGEELKNLGKNISSFLRTAWESPERQGAQKEIEEGLAEMIAVLNKAVGDFRQSKTGQQVEEDVADLKRRIDNGEIGSKVRDDIRQVLEKINSELEKGSAPRGSDSSSKPPPDDTPPSNS